MNHPLKKHAESPPKKNIPFLEVILGTILAIMIWRGCWWFLDQYLFPANPFLSHMLCIAIPLCIVIIWVIISGYNFTWRFELDNIAI